MQWVLGRSIAVFHPQLQLAEPGSLSSTLSELAMPAGEGPWYYVAHCTAVH